MSASLGSAFAGSVERISPQLAYRLGIPDAPPKLRKGAPPDTVLFRNAFTDAKTGNRERAIEGFEQTVRINPKFGDAHYNLGVTFLEASEFEKALEAFQTAIAVDVKLASAYFGIGCALGALGRFDDEIAAYDDLLARFGTTDEPPLREQVAKALYNKGVTFRTLQRGNDEIAAYDDLLARFDTEDEPRLREQVAKALANKGIALSKLGRSEDAITAYDDLLFRFGTEDEPLLRPVVANALHNKGVALHALRRWEDSIPVFDDLLARLGTTNELPFEVAIALYTKGVALFELGRSEDAITVYDDLLSRFGTADEPPLRQIVAHALTVKQIIAQQNPDLVLVSDRTEYTEPVPGAITAPDRGSEPPEAQDLSGTDLTKRADFHALADDALNRGLSSEEFKEAIEDKLTAKAQAAAREATAHAKAEPRPKTIADAKAEALGIGDTTLLGQLNRYEARLASTELPEEGLKSLEQAEAAARLAKTYQDLQARQLMRGLDPLPKDDRVTAAQRLAPDYYRKHPKPKAKATRSPPRAGKSMRTTSPT